MIESYPLDLSISLKRAEASLSYCAIVYPSRVASFFISVSEKTSKQATISSGVQLAPKSRLMNKGFSLLKYSSLKKPVPPCLLFANMIACDASNVPAWNPISPYLKSLNFWSVQCHKERIVPSSVLNTVFENLLRTSGGKLLPTVSVSFNSVLDNFRQTPCKNLRTLCFSL